jgi:hypothetical protein
VVTRQSVLVLDDEPPRRKLLSGSKPGRPASRSNWVRPLHVDDEGGRGRHLSQPSAESLQRRPPRRQWRLLVVRRRDLLLEPRRVRLASTSCARVEPLGREKAHLAHAIGRGHWSKNA